MISRILTTSIRPQFVLKASCSRALKDFKLSSLKKELDAFCLDFPTYQPLEDAVEQFKNIVSNLLQPAFMWIGNEIKVNLAIHRLFDDQNGRFAEKVFELNQIVIKYPSLLDLEKLYEDRLGFVSLWGDIVEQALGHLSSNR